MNSAKPARVPIAGKKKISERSRYERIDKVRFGLIYKRLLAFRYPNECFSLHRTKRVLAQCTNLEAQTRTQCMYIGITHDTHVLCMCVWGGGSSFSNREVLPLQEPIYRLCFIPMLVCTKMCNVCNVHTDFHSCSPSLEKARQSNQFPRIRVSLCHLCSYLIKI